MKKVTSDVVDVFWEDGVPVGILILNGKSEFYKVSHADKRYIRERLLDTKDSNEAVRKMPQGPEVEE